MIEDEVLAILNSTGDQGEELNSLADQYRAGRDAEDLLGLLRSQNNDLVRIGAWIIGEISFEYYNTPDFTDRLWELTEHDIPAIRFRALGALFPALDRTQRETRDLIAKLRNDPNEGVRLAAEAAAGQLGMSEEPHTYIAVQEGNIWKIVAEDNPAKVLKTLPAGTTADEAARLAQKATDDAAAEAASAGVNRSFRELIKDVTTNPSKWQVVKKEILPFTNMRNKGRTSVQELLRNIDTGEEIVRHTLLKPDGTIFEPPHFRPFWK